MAFPHDGVKFQKGNNVGGRKQGSLTRSRLVREVLEMDIDISTFDEKKKKEFLSAMTSLGISADKVPVEKLMTIAMAFQSLKGDAKAYMALMDSGYGKLPQVLEIGEAENEEYDFKLLTPDELAELDRIQPRYIELIAKATIRKAETEGGE